MSDHPATMTQRAPYPTALAEMVKRCRYRPNWTVRLVDDLDRDFAPDDSDRNVAVGGGMTLVITTATVNSYRPKEHIRVAHYFIVPAATYDARSWRRWLFEQFCLVERHEAMEFFCLEWDEHDERPYAPSHGPGNDPYMVREVGTEADVRTSFRGQVNP